jgi:hypothetical protein
MAPQADVSQSYALVQVRDGLAVLERAGEYDVSLLLELATPTPLDGILAALVQLLAADADQALCLPAQRATRGRAPCRLPRSGRWLSLGSRQRLAQAAAPRRRTSTRAQAGRRSAHSSRCRASATFEDPQLRWRWRLVNVALRAGSSGGRRMTPAQLRYLHARLAAIVRYCLRAAAIRARGGRGGRRGACCERGRGDGGRQGRRCGRGAEQSASWRPCCESMGA